MKIISILSCVFFFTQAQSNYYGAVGTNLPIQIDGDTSDFAWNNATWQPIDKLWIPYDNSLSSGFPTESGTQVSTGPTDFKGKYKIVWSSTLNKLVILIDIIDDVFIDGYVPPSGNYPNYDLPEIFIDEDNSKTPHLYDVPSPFQNAESAFAYHVAANAPTINNVTTSASPMDIGGTNLSSVILNYVGHFPQFALKNLGNNHYVYKMTLNVYNDTYPADFTTYTSNLVVGKIMGFALNYCDNDANDNSRDHFFSSVTVAGVDNNVAWQTSRVYGELELLPEMSSITGLDTTKVTHNSAVFGWNGSLTNQTIAGFLVYRNNILVGTTTGTVFSLSGLNISTYYDFKIVALFATGKYSNSSSISFATKPHPTSVTGLDTVAVTQNKIILTWNPVVQYFTPTQFYIYKNQTLSGITTGSRFTLAGLNTLTSYTIYVKAKRSDGQFSNSSQVLTVTTKNIATEIPKATLVGINFGDAEEINSFQIYPNPATEILFIKNKEEVQFLTTIYNIYTQIIYTKSENKAVLEINIENFPKGVYFVAIQAKNGVFTTKFYKL